jgi:hypothetical protein
MARKRTKGVKPLVVIEPPSEDDGEDSEPSPSPEEAPKRGRLRRPLSPSPPNPHQERLLEEEAAEEKRDAESVLPGGLAFDNAFLVWLEQQVLLAMDEASADLPRKGIVRASIERVEGGIWAQMRDELEPSHASDDCGALRAALLARPYASVSLELETGDFVCVACNHQRSAVATLTLSSDDESEPLAEFRLASSCLIRTLLCHTMRHFPARVRRLVSRGLADPELTAEEDRTESVERRLELVLQDRRWVDAILATYTAVLGRAKSILAPERADGPRRGAGGVAREGTGVFDPEALTEAVSLARIYALLPALMPGYQEPEIVDVEPREDLPDVPRPAAPAQYEPISPHEFGTILQTVATCVFRWRHRADGDFGATAIEVTLGVERGVGTRCSVCVRDPQKWEVAYFNGLVKECIGRRTGQSFTLESSYQYGDRVLHWSGASE